MEIMRLIVTGAVGAGKSTLIRSVSEIKVVNIEPQATDQTSLLKEKTALALDYGRLNFSPKVALYLYGTPGQAKFDFIWDHLIRRAHGCIVLVAANRPGNFCQTRRLLAFIKARVQIPIIIGITHTDCQESWCEEDVTIALGYANQKQRPTIVTVNPTQKASAVQALMTLGEQFKSTTQVAGYCLETLVAA
jgi:signal recognition particle receptor subunit beta